MPRGGTDNLISPGNLSFLSRKQSLNRSIPTSASSSGLAVNEEVQAVGEQ